jgi:hypothetical protein
VIRPACGLAVLIIIIIIIIIITVIIWCLGLALHVLYCVNRSKYCCHEHLSVALIAIPNFLLDIITTLLIMDNPATSCLLTVLNFEPVHLHSNCRENHLFYQ